MYTNIHHFNIYSVYLRYLHVYIYIYIYIVYIYMYFFMYIFTICSCVCRRVFLNIVLSEKDFLIVRSI